MFYTILDLHSSKLPYNFIISFRCFFSALEELPPSTNPPTIESMCMNIRCSLDRMALSFSLFFNFIFLSSNQLSQKFKLLGKRHMNDFILFLTLSSHDEIF